jgi:hypothetical protein
LATLDAQKPPNALTRKVKPSGVFCTHRVTASGDGMAYVELSTSTHPKCSEYFGKRATPELISAEV